MTTALIADDEPLLRERLASQLLLQWPDLQIVAQARNGREAIELFDQHLPQIAFLDVHMPGRNGIEVARAIGNRARIVFVTAYDHYAVQAFEQGAVDYLVKPFEVARLAQTVARLRQVPQAAATVSADLEPLLSALNERLQAQTPAAPASAYLQWIKASVGPAVRLISVAEVVFIRSDEKYTLVVCQSGEVLIRKTIRELADELDPQRFVQIHRSVIVALAHVDHVTRGPGEGAELHLRQRREVLPVSRSYTHQFRQM